MHLVKKSVWILIVCCLASLVAAFFGLRSCQRQVWERTLYGPYTGAAYSGSITTAPVSVLAIPARGQLEVHEIPAYTNSLVLLRSPAGAIQWSRLLVPEKRQTDGTMYRASLRELRLHNWERRGTVSVVFITCVWDWGGREGGLIELDKDYEFRSFKVSW